MIEKRIGRASWDNNEINSYWDELAQRLAQILESHSTSWSLWYIDDLRWLEKDLENHHGQLIVIVYPDEYDYLGSDPLRTPLTLPDHRRPEKLLVLEKVSAQHPQREFVFVQASPDCDQTLRPNVRLLHGGDRMFLQHRRWPVEVRKLEKKFSAPWHSVLLALQSKNHRALAAIRILGQGLVDRALLRISADAWQHCDRWQDLTMLDCAVQDPVMDRGWQLFRDNRHGGQPAGDVLFTPGHQGDAVWNFNHNLRHILQHSMIQFVGETMFVPQCRMVTEKFLGSVYAQNFPIMISAPRTVEYLRSIGFDMFDDVLSHHYDQVRDPLQRIFRAVDDNLCLLKDRELAQEKWLSCQDRFQKNIDHAKKSLYNTRMDLALTQFQNLINQGDING